MTYIPFFCLLISRLIIDLFANRYALLYCLRFVSVTMLLFSLFLIEDLIAETETIELRRGAVNLFYRILTKRDVVSTIPSALLKLAVWVTFVSFEQEKPLMFG